VEKSSSRTPTGPRKEGLPVRSNAPWAVRSSEMFKKFISRKKRKDALIPIIEGLIERYQNSRRDFNKFDQMFQRALNRYPAVKSILPKITEGYRQISETEKAEKFYPIPTEKTTPLSPISRSKAKTFFQSVEKPYLDILAQMNDYLIISKIEPTEEEGYKPGNSVTIFGYGFADYPEKNRILLEHTQPAQIIDAPSEYSIEVYQKDMGKLTFKLPWTIFPGLWMVKVEAKSKTSNSIPIYIPYQIMITAVNPAQPMEGYPSDQVLTIEGEGFADPAITEYKRIEFFQGNETQPTYSLNSELLPDGKLRVSLFHVEPGAWKIRIFTKDHGFSNFWPIWVNAVPENQPVITDILVFGTTFHNRTPEPGQAVLIKGQNFDPNKPTYVHWYRYKNEELVSYFITPATILNETSIKTTILNMAFPGTYRVILKKEGAPFSEPYNLTIKYPEYKLIFTKIKCLDESNWWGTEWGSDEIVTFWTVNADLAVWNKNTGEYKGFDDGDEKNYNSADRNIFKPDGSWGEIKYRLNVVIKLYEWDWGSDVHATYEYLGQLGKDIAVDLLGEKGVEIVEDVIDFVMEVTGLDILVEYFSDLCSWIASLFGADPDGLGTQFLTWSSYDLQSMLLPGETYQGHVDFINDSDTGSYRLYYELKRRPNP